MCVHMCLRCSYANDRADYNSILFSAAIRADGNAYRMAMPCAFIPIRFVRGLSDLQICDHCT